MGIENRWVTVDGNEAAASVAYRASEVIAIYPITPSSAMGEHSDEWSAARRPNLWGAIPDVIEMQSEGGAAGAVHGALQAGALATTFTASQGLLLMIPNMYKIAGELLPFCMHVAARAVATHALSIFGDHSDVMACRQTGFAMLCAGSVQEAQDFAAIAHAATLRARVPFLHFFDGFRTSHEIAKIQALSDDDLRALLDERAIAAHRARALTPDHPVIRGTAQNPDTFFQAREAANPFYLACPEVVRETMARFAALTGRRYDLFEYVGHPEAERIVVLMGSGAEAAQEAVERLVAARDRVGLVKVRLYRPFDVAAFAAALPATVRGIAVLDRTKEPGAPGEPLYLDVCAALREARARGIARWAGEPAVIGGRYGLSSKEFTPSMAKAALDELKRPHPKDHFTVGIIDDVTHASLPVARSFDEEPADVARAVFFGLGADGTVGANKNSIKIIGEEPGRFAQGYFVYDSKKSGAVTISHLRFGPRPIRSTYLVREASFVACHHLPLLERYDVLGMAAPGATVLLNAPFPPERVWENLPRDAQEKIVERGCRLFAIDAYEVAEELGLGRRINGIMQACFFALSGALPRDVAIERIKAAIAKTYGRKGEDVVRANWAAVDAALARLHEIPVPEEATATARRRPPVPEDAPAFVRRVTGRLLAGEGDWLPVSAFPVDGTWPVGTARWEKRNLAREIPSWVPDLCIQCNKCAFVCPHAAIRPAVVEPAALEGAPETLKSTGFRSRELPGLRYLLQVAPEDCTACTLCVEACPAHDKADPARKALGMVPQPPVRERERANWDFFTKLPPLERAAVKADVKGSQLFEPLFEFSGACVGCGETPYLKLLTQLFGDRLLIANATGCSSIFGGNLPTTPYTANRDGRGPAWANSLFEDNAEFGLGMRAAVDCLEEQARDLLARLAGRVGGTLAEEILGADQADEAGIAAQRARVAAMRERLAGIDAPEARRLETIVDYLVRKTVWIVGGDGWAYDIGFGGLDHVLALGRKVNALVLDTEVYSNTGGQQSKATPRGAAAKFATAGKRTAKKDLGLMAMAYGNVYVARVAFGAKDAQTLKAFQEADAYPGPALIIAMSPCIAHGYDLGDGLTHQKLAVESGYWPLYRYDPRRAERGEPPLVLDSAPPKGDGLRRIVEAETRFKSVEREDPEAFREILAQIEREIAARFALYERIAGRAAGAR